MASNAIVTAHTYNGVNYLARVAGETWPQRKTTDAFFTEIRRAHPHFGAACYHLNAQGHKCPHCHGVYILPKDPGYVYYIDSFGQRWDVTRNITGNTRYIDLHVCASCGYIEGRGPNHPTMWGFVVDPNAGATTQQTNAQIANGIISKLANQIAQKTKPQRLCQCGAWATGVPDYSVLHDNTRTFTCPAYKETK